jgi:hypothetical protein
MSAERPTPAQRRYLERGLSQAGGKLPLFDEQGQRISASTIEACLRHGWAEPWFANPIKPDWLVCKLTERGRKMAATGNGRARRRAGNGAKLLTVAARV